MATYYISYSLAFLLGGRLAGGRGQKAKDFSRLSVGIIFQV
jgi:hypothetical protein